MRLIVETLIAAPREVVFDLARDVGARLDSSRATEERAVLQRFVDAQVRGVFKRLRHLHEFEGARAGR